MIEVDRDTIEGFASFFKGRTDSHGVVNKCAYEPVTLKHYEKHLKGEVNLGIYFLLDDSTCHFAAIDLDEKDFNKAKAIRNELTKNFVPAYIAASKSKGFHIYCFALERFKATEIRRVLKHLLDKLNIKAEVFPKQDYHQPDDSDGTKHPGSYINLPCFGHTRPFLSGDMKEVKLEVALERIKFVPQESIDRVLQTLPKEKPLEPKKVERKRRLIYPPCLEVILQGVDEKQRDAAAFALARYYLIQVYKPEEVFWLLQEWDTKNKPPSYNEPLLEQAVRSAEKYRGSFCSLIKSKPTVSTFCVGDEKCDWLKKLKEMFLTQDEEPDKLNKIAVEKLLGTCAFLRYCRKDAATLPEPHWWSMVHVLAVFGDLGSEKIHELSKPYLRYTEKETGQKIDEAKKAADKEIGPHTCTFIEQELGFDCPKDCPAKKLDVKSPAGMAKKLASQEIHGIYIIWDKKGNAKVNVKGLIDDLMEGFVFKTIYGIVKDDILVYLNGVYTSIGEKVIRQECERRVEAPLMTTHLVNEIRDHIARRTFSERDKFNTEKYIINFENGLFDINTKALRPHTPEVLSTIRIPISYDPSARCPKISKFLHEILREDDIKIIFEFFGYALIPDYSIPVVLILLGEGSNGKSQLFILLRRFIGHDNFCSVSLHSIEGYPFAVASLEGKLLNIQGDLSNKWLSGIGMLKQLSGQDPIEAPRKHRDSITFDNFARLVFASNKPPVIEEDTLAVWRRILPLDLPNKFQGKNEVKDIIEKILTPQELSGLLNLALEGLERLLANGDFSYKGTFDDRAKQYTTASDPPKAFVAERCLSGMGFEILKSELYQAYVQFCGEKKVQISGEAQFGKDLRQVPGLSLTVKQHRDKGEILRWWVGIKLQPTEIDMDI
ncbi:hypothetical protein ES708_18503 [subsurface metagenome]